MLQLYHQNCSFGQNTTLQKRWLPLRPSQTVTLFVTSYPYGCGMMRSQNRSVPLIMTVGVTYTMVPSIIISRPQMELPSTLHKLLTTLSTMPKPPMPLPRQHTPPITCPITLVPITVTVALISLEALLAVEAMLHNL